jgi:hypothetical protein
MGIKEVEVRTAQRSPWQNTYVIVTLEAAATAATP